MIGNFFYFKNILSSNFYPITKCNAILTSYLKLNNLFSIGTGEIIINQELKDKSKFLLNKFLSF